MKSKLLTIVIPVHNTDLTKLRRCLKSIPDHPDVFVDIYDDYTTSYCTELEISKMIKEDESLKHLYKEGNGFIRSEVNIGLGAIRNSAIKRLYEESSDNKYIMFLDSDDEVVLDNEVINFIKSHDNSDIISFGINLIDENNNVYYEHCEKYLRQSMIPYFATSNIYDINFLYEENIKFDDSRMIFEDIIFTVDLWTMALTKNVVYTTSKDVIYNYYLNGESLTRNDKYLTQADHLDHWVEWIISRFSELDEDQKNWLKPYYFNRVRYEKAKSLELRMKANGDINKYKELLSYLKPHRIDSILPD